VSDAAHTPQHEPSHVDARSGSGLTMIYQALDRLVSARALDDAAVVVDVETLGRQVLRAGRRPLRDDEQRLLERPPGLYVTGDGADGADDELLADLMVTLAELGLRHDLARLSAEPGTT
jgi:D-serine deaminase-like pyridoxal phosphate-dependent protein